MAKGTPANPVPSRRTGPHAKWWRAGTPVNAMAGYQKVLEGAKVLPDYAYGAPPRDGTPPAFSSATLASNGPSPVHNSTVRLGYEFKPTPKLAFMMEGFLVQSRFRLLQVDEGRTGPVRTSLGLEAGALLSF